MCPGPLFVETGPGTPEHEKLCVDVSFPGRTRMHYVTHRSHQMQKHKFGVTSPNALFVATAPGPLEHEKLCIDISRPGRTEMNYVS
jgi:hypothetical protein